VVVLSGHDRSDLRARGAIHLLLLLSVVGCGESSESPPTTGQPDTALAHDAGDPIEDASSLDDVVNPPLDSELPPSDSIAADSEPVDGALVDAPSTGTPSCPVATERGCGRAVLAGGTFAMGEIGANAATPVQASITVGAFELDTHEVTIARFRRFWNAGRPAPSAIAYPSGSIAWAGVVREPIRVTTNKLCNWSSTPDVREEHPLACLDWWTAQAFCVWDGGRLPTAAEWEWAARARIAGGLTAPRTYPWGNVAPAPGCDRAEWNFCKGDDSAPTRRVGSFAPTPDIYDLAGNVREWMADSYAAFTNTTCWGGSARTNPLCNLGATSLREYRGGSWCSTTIDTLKSAARYARSATSPTDFLGFRCARNR